MAQYSYPGNDQRYDPSPGNRRKYKSCVPARSGKRKVLEWTIFLLFVFDVFCQFMTRIAMVGFAFWWIDLGNDVLVLMFIMFLITR